MNLESTPSFLALLDEMAACFGVERLENQEITESAIEIPIGNIELSNENGSILRFQIQQENVSEWSGIRARIVFGINIEEQEWSDEQVLLQSILICRVIPGTIFPLVPTLLPDKTFEFQCLIPLDIETKGRLLSFISFMSAFYQKLIEKIREIGFSDALAKELKVLDRSLEALWTLGAWEHYKKTYPSQTKESYSKEGHYYRLFLATEEMPGMIAINLGDLSDFMSLPELFLTLLKLNTITFLTGNYYIGMDDRNGLLLSAFLPPASEQEIVLSVNQLLERAAATRVFLTEITNKLEGLRLQEELKDYRDIEGLVFS